MKTPNDSQATGQQGAGDDDVLEMLCRLERLAVVHRVNGSVEWKLLVEQAADMIRRLATPQPPKPAGCGACGDDCKDRGSCRLADESPKPAGAVPILAERRSPTGAIAPPSTTADQQYPGGCVLLLPDNKINGRAVGGVGKWLVNDKWLSAYGKAREAAAVDANEGSEQWTKAGAYDMIAEAVENSGVEVNSIVEYVNYLIGLDSAGRADAVQAWFGELPAPISNPEAWPANYAGGYNDALNMCYDVIRGHAPQQMTTQGEEQP